VHEGTTNFREHEGSYSAIIRPLEHSNSLKISSVRAHKGSYGMQIRPFERNNSLKI